MTFDEWYRSIYPKTVEADVFELLKDVWAKASLGAYEDCAVFVDTKEAYSVDRDYRCPFPAYGDRKCSHGHRGLFAQTGEV